MKISQVKYIGCIELNTEEDNSGEWFNWQVVMRETINAEGEKESRLIFGSACNVGLLGEGHLILEDWESTVEGLQELVADLRVLITDGPAYVSRIVLPKGE